MHEAVDRQVATQPVEEQVHELEREVLRASRELHRTHRELASLRERLRGERAEREELFTLVGHELRTPLAVIGGYARLLLAEGVGPLTAEQRRFLDETQKSCRRLDTFVERLLDAGREPGSEVLEVASGPLAPPLDEAARAVRPLFQERDLSLVLPPPVCGTRARFDRFKLEQVLTNLLRNAARHARPGGRVEVQVRERRQGERRVVEIAVSDDGAGVAPQDRERIFEPYVRGDDARESDGLGLGLAICRRLVEAHGGTIGVSEGSGGGARFAFTLPGAEV